MSYKQSEPDFVPFNPQNLESTMPPSKDTDRTFEHDRRLHSLEQSKRDDIIHELTCQLAVMEERQRGEAMAMTIQAKEYERRLLDLNHAHEKQVIDQATYVGREAYLTFQKDYFIWKDQTQTELSRLQGRSGGFNSAQSLLFNVLPIVISVITFLIVYFKK